MDVTSSHHISNPNFGSRTQTSGLEPKLRVSNPNFNIAFIFVPAFVQTSCLAHFCAMADHSLAMSALRVAVYAPRDDEMRALARELAAARRANIELQRHVGRLEVQHDGEIEALTEDKAELQQRLNMLEQHLEVARDFRVEQHSIRAEREIRLAREGDRLARWAAQGRVEEDMPVEILRAVRLMRQDDVTSLPVGTFSFVEMEVDSAAVL
jgi:hypothetical protein